MWVLINSSTGNEVDTFENYNEARRACSQHNCDPNENDPHELRFENV